MPRVLIVEDDKLLRELYCTILKEHTIFEAETSNQAISLTLQHQPDLIVTDLSIPDSNGTLPKESSSFEIISMLRRINDKVKIIVCSGLCCDSYIQQQAIIAGANLSLPKGISIKTLKQTINQFLVG